ncbi:HD domain-containing protein [Leifsonia poae]|uniref:Cyanamide hydratase n=1 Tax=Leifsonia poae TaxID=110933 RepID=A0A9W6HCR2_9MICO|nr:HD domain-containing protein [Leifsonia poae]GLJ77363.1 cyanamide hydratase [Leifsonia poae]
MRLSEITAPDTSAARAALEIATAYHSPSLLNHVQRSWLWALGFAEARGLEPDHELLYVSALLHDLGIVPAFDNHTLAYEDAAGHVAIALTAGSGWPDARRVRAHEVIVRHNWPEVDPEFDVEGHLLSTSTALDISGANADELSLDFRREVLERYPRGELAAEFTACVKDQAIRKPETAARRLVDGGVERKLRENPLERLLEG